MWTAAAQVGWLGLRVGRVIEYELALSMNSSNQLRELMQWLHYDDTTIDIIIIRTHRTAMYTDAAYCYRLSSMVCL